MIGRLARVQRFEEPLETLFPFFAEARNLEGITPPWLSFRIVSAPAGPISAGALLQYRLRWRGIPFSWTTEIASWDPPNRFVDRQIQGPYRLWEHEHRFITRPDGLVEMIDRVWYRAPLAPLTHPLVVRADVERIFDYRSERLAQLFRTANMSSRPGCKVCGEEPEHGRLATCELCRARLCPQHVLRKAGKSFCDKRCADEFFFGEPEEEPD